MKKLTEIEFLTKLHRASDYYREQLGASKEDKVEIALACLENAKLIHAKSRTEVRHELVTAMFADTSSHRMIHRSVLYPMLRIKKAWAAYQRATRKPKKNA